MPLQIDVANPQQSTRFEHAAGPLELGRGPERHHKRFVIDDMFVSRDQLRIEELADGRVRVDNLSGRNVVELSAGQGIAAAQSRELTPPIQLSVGETRVAIDRVAPRANATSDTLSTRIAPDVLRPSVLATIDVPSRSARCERPIQIRHDSEPSALLQGLTQWLETVIDLQQAPAGSAQFFQQTAQALIDLIGMDLGLVLVRRDGSWTVAGSAAANDRVGVRFSRTLLEQVVAERRTFYQDLNQLRSDAVSLADIESAVVSPVFGLQGDVVGALYGMRTQEGIITRGAIEPLEAQLVQLLAAAAGANLARSLAARTRMQFEQFFSPELVRELERDPNLLEGRTEEVTVLGAAKTCRIVRDMMERLSEQITGHGGVIVDYAGDGILAMWNAPAKQSDHAARACRAAAAMLAELPALNARWSSETDGAALSMGIGVNTGDAQVGNTGSSRKLKYGPHGHTVNLASRVQDATKHLGLPLLITEHVRRYLPADFQVRRLGQVRLPGVTEPVVLYEMHGEQAEREWLDHRDAYERALQRYETGQWSQACETLMPLVAAAAHKESFDVPTLKLMRRAWECLETRPDKFEPIIEATTK
jgi:adenylate cyclase